MHMHVGVLEGLVVAAYVIVILFFARMAAAKWHDTTLGKGLAFLVS